MRLAPRLCYNLNKYFFHYLHLLAPYPLKQFVSVFFSFYYVFSSSQFLNVLMIHKRKNEHNLYHFCRYNFCTVLVWVNEHHIVCYDLQLVHLPLLVKLLLQCKEDSFSFLFCILECFFIINVFFGAFENFCCFSFLSLIAEVKCSKSLSSSKTLSLKDSQS